MASNNPSSAFAFDGKVNQVLSHHKVADVVPKRKVVSVMASQSVAETFSLLSENKILSVPVLRDATAENEPLGFVDLLAIVRYVLGKVLKDPEDNSEAGRLTEADLKKVSLESVTNGELLAALNIGAVVPFYDGNPATYLPRLFTNHLHRTIVYSEITKPDGVHRDLKMTSVCSQSDLVRYLAKLSEEDGPLARIFDVSLREAGFKRQGQYQVATVSPDTTVLAALHKMSFLGFRAVAIVDGAGALLGTFSVESLRGLGLAQQGDLCRSVLDFVKDRAPGALEPATVKTTEPVSGVLARFSSQGLHEAWVLGEDRHVEGVVTQTDLIQALAQRGSNLDAAAVAHENKEFAFKLPGRLLIKVASGHSISGGTLFRPARAGVRVSLGDSEELFKTSTQPGSNPRWGETFTLDVTPELARANQVLVFTVFDEARRFEEIGYFRVSLKWIVRAFGTDQAALRNFADAFRIRQDNKPGEVQVEFLWLE